MKNKKSVRREIRNISLMIVVFIMMIISSCSKRTAPLYDGCCPKIDLSRESDTTLIDFIDNISLLPVERNENFIYFVSPVVAAIDTTYMFMVDNRTGMIAGFNEGKIVFSKRCVGRGPGEIQELGNVFINERMLGLYDRVMLKTVFYDEKGVNKRIERTKENYMEYYKLSEKYAIGLRADELETNQYLKFIKFKNNNSKIVGRWNELEDWQLSLFTYPSISCLKNGKLTNYVPYGYYIYQIDSTSVEKKYFLDYGEKVIDNQFLKKYKSSDPLQFSIDVFMSGINGKVAQLQEINDYYYLTFIKDFKWYSAIIEKQTNLVYSTIHVDDDERIWGDLFANIMFSTSTENKMYGVVSIKKITEIINSYNNIVDIRIQKLMKDVKNYQLLYQLDESEYVVVALSLK